MEKNILFFVVLVLCLWEVNPMSLKGPMLIRYDPCGLGVIHFDKIRDNYWRGIVHFGLYENLAAAEMVIVFESDFVMYKHNDTSKVIEKRTNPKDIILYAVRPFPAQYVFYVTLSNLNVTKSDVPNVVYLALNNVTLCNEQIKASQTIKSFNVSEPNNNHLQRQVCGRRSMEHTELVSVRTESRAGDWPWHVAILLQNNDGVFRYECGGNIISRTSILTAGHCVYKSGLMAPNRVEVIAGTNMYKDLSQVGRQTFRAQQIILHPAYVDDLATSDLAIIKVTGIQYTEYVQPICLWGPVYDKPSLFGREVTVIGFGMTEFNKQSDVLRSTYTMIQNDTACIAFSRKLYSGLLNEFTFCAGYGPTSTINPRNGDSGGGLVLSTIQADHKISWFLRGVLSKCGVSPGNKNCDPTYYVVYTDVGPHYGWIYHHADLNFRNNVVRS